MLKGCSPGFSTLWTRFTSRRAECNHFNEPAVGVPLQNMTIRGHQRSVLSHSLSESKCIRKRVPKCWKYLRSLLTSVFVDLSGIVHVYENFISLSHMVSALFLFSWDSRNVYVKSSELYSRIFNNFESAVEGLVCGSFQVLAGAGILVGQNNCHMLVIKSHTVSRVTGVDERVEEDLVSHTQVIANISVYKVPQFGLHQQKFVL